MMVIRDTISLTDVDLLEFGNTVQLGAVVYVGNGKTYVVPMPDEDPLAIDEGMPDSQLMVLSAGDWEKLLRQTDELNIRSGPEKAIVRKSQRQVDSNIAWRVFERDGYRCRYCNQKKPLSVDHLILWENGGITVEENLLAACKPCNRRRGNREYGEWLDSKDYQKTASVLPKAVREANEAIRAKLPYLGTLSVSKQRSR